jgi:capsular polysaccharide biosynthesis protein
VDVWDLTKLLWRRWYVALPLLIATAAITVYLTSTVKPDYVLASHLLLTPPPAGDDPVETERAQATNPWIGLGSNALAQAGKLSIEGADVIEDLDTRDLSTSYVVSVASYSPIITIEVVAQSLPQATETANRLVAVFEANVEQLQKGQGASTSALMGVQRLPGDTLEERDSNVKRVMVAVGASGVLLSLGLTVAVDALIRRRRRSVDIDSLASLPSPLVPDPMLGAGRPPTLPAGAPLTLPAGAPPPVPAEAPTSPVPQLPLPVPDEEPRTAEYDMTVVLPLPSRGRGNKRP